MSKEFFSLEIELINETEKAYQIKTNSDKLIWLPKSLCLLENNEIIMPLWLATSKGLTE